MKLVLIGRTELLEGSDAASRLRSLSREAERTGSAIAYRAADVRDFAALERALTSAREEVRATAPLDGVIHLAGAYREAGVLEETKEGFEESLAAKTLGAVALGRLLGDRKDALFVCASSVNGYFGGFHVGAYASGNRFLRGFVQARRLAGFPRSFCLDFSMWHDIGISRGFGMRDAARARGYESIETAQGIRSLLAVVGRQDPSLVEVLIGLDESRPNVRSRLVAGPDSSLERLTAFVRLTPGLESAPSLLVPEDRFGVVSSGEIAPVREIPRTERGEVDLERLRGSLRSRSQDRRTAEALSDTEIRVAAIWKELLGVPRVGVLDNFFELGGHSLLAAQAVARINSAFSVALSLPVLFEAPSVQALSRRVDADLWVAMEAPVLAESTGVARDEGEI